MWKLISIKAENLCAFQDLSYHIPQDVTTLVFGNNMDNDSQGSNGSGKSALIEAIAIALTGDPLRKVKMDEIINDAAEEAVVSAVLYNSAIGIQMTINRRLSRKQPQIVQVVEQIGPYDADTEEIKQASVADYNKYILDKIGLTKEDIYSNFILCRNKYRSFLSCNDKEKKELINRFSNGDQVDMSIETLRSDIEGVQKRLQEADKEVSFFQGKVETYAEQISNLMDEAEDNEASKAKRLADIKKRISETREKIREANRQIQIVNQDWDDVEELERSFQKIEQMNMPFDTTSQKIQKLWKNDLLGQMQDFEAKISSIRNDIKKLTTEHDESVKCLSELEEYLGKVVKDFEAIDEEYDSLVESNKSVRESIAQQIQDCRKVITDSNSAIQNLLFRKQKDSKAISDLMAMLSGTIECPACHHKWVIDSELSIDELSDKLGAAKTRQEEVDKEIEATTVNSNNARREISQSESRKLELDEKERELLSQVAIAKQKKTKIESSIQSLQDRLESIEARMDELNKRIRLTQTDMFDFIYDTVDNAINRFESHINQLNNEIELYNGSLETLEASKREIEEYSIGNALEALRDTLKDAEKSLSKAEKAKNETDTKLSALKVQEARFIEFKTYLANSKVEALSALTNEFLSAIGSDIRIVFSGITMLKSGKIRDKISISLWRDGVDCGSYDKFSQGERSRCELATILALQKLINTNCDEGKGLDLLVIDEIMDGIDENGLTNIFETLNKLQVTSLVVSHGAVSEGYSHRLIVNKENGVSFI